MPILDSNSYHPHFLLRLPHFSTMLPNLLRRVDKPNYHRVRINTTDEDFLDLDYVKTGGEVVAIICHGLEGSTDRDYIRSIVNEMGENNWDSLAINLRGCSGEVNAIYGSYHSGKTDDLDLVVNYAIEEMNYQKIILIGYSLGGNITLKYVGERGTEINKNIKAAAAISVPVHLSDSAEQLAKRSNVIYMKRFIRMLKPKLKEKLLRFPQEELSLKELNSIRDFHGFDSLYTAPAHGFSSANDYWEKSSSLQFLKSIRIPTLLINAKDDPFLGPACYPFKEAEESDHFFFEAPDHGGHVGFASSLFEKGPYWNEKRMIDFFKEKVIL
jgi:predicted alpha/beta-fold hydrolase